MNVKLRVRRLGVDDWQVWRDTRLAALADTPDAFGSSLDRETQYDERTWRDEVRPDRGLKAVALMAGAPAGLVGAGVPDAGGGVVELFGMWVAPTRRGHGFDFTQKRQPHPRLPERQELAMTRLG